MSNATDPKEALAAIDAKQKELEAALEAHKKETEAKRKEYLEQTKKQDLETVKALCELHGFRVSDLKGSLKVGRTASGTKSTTRKPRATKGTKRSRSS
jgi:restriction endonuclease S subunit